MSMVSPLANSRDSLYCSMTHPSETKISIDHYFANVNISIHRRMSIMCSKLSWSVTRKWQINLKPVPASSVVDVIVVFGVFQSSSAVKVISMNFDSEVSFLVFYLYFYLPFLCLLCFFLCVFEIMVSESQILLLCPLQNSMSRLWFLIN